MMSSIKRTIRIPQTPDKAFKYFVTQLNEWWPKEYTWSRQDLVRIKITPKKNGLCTEIGPYGFRCDWGRVTQFKVNKKISLKWQISPSRVPEPNPEKASNITIKFEASESPETLLTFEHSAFQNHGKGFKEYQKAMDSEMGWDYILNKYEAYCEDRK